MNSSDLADIVNGTLSGPPDLPVFELFTDSRQLIYSEGLVFFAINGKNHDGHQFIGTLYQRGVRIFVTEKRTDLLRGFPDASFIYTGSVILALQKLAAYRRKTFKSPVIAVTGSAGKTIVKEWLAEVIGLSTPVIRSPRSYNSQIGVPLSVWQLDNKFKYGIIEAGISEKGEMEKLRKVIEPDIGVFTNIGDAHSENFPDIKTKAREKLKLFKGSGTIIYCRDQTIIHDLIITDPELSSGNLFDWSCKDPHAKIFVAKRSVYEGFTSLAVTFKGKQNHFEIPFADRASVENAITVAAVCLALGLDADIIGRGMSALVSVAMRMEMKSGINNCQLIEDCYNSDPGSLSMALEYMSSKNGRKTTLILSDFIQSSRDDRELYGDIASIVSKTGIARFIGIGKIISENRDLFGDNARFYNSTGEFIRGINPGDFRDEIILLKGARVFEFERIGRLLEQKTHQTVLEINLDAVAHNLNEFRRHLDPQTKLMVMVKAFAYGAGPAEIGALLEYHRVSYLAVAYADEAVELRKAGVTLPVMVMNPEPDASDLIIKYNLEPELFSIGSFNEFLDAASRNGLVNYPVHIKIDTGMHRLGFMPGDIGTLARMIRSTDCFKIVSVFSHLSGSGDPSLDNFSKRQVEIFLKAVAEIREATGYHFMRHILNSSGIARLPQYQFEMVRPGIGIYGIGHFEGMSLRLAGRFRTRISQIKKIYAGEPVGYGCADVSDKERYIAILPVGYADGLNRMLGNRIGSLFIKGKKVPIIGNVCMDMCMADVSGVDATAGDEAEIFGENISIDEIALQCKTIPYEILTSIPVRVKRVFFRE